MIKECGICRRIAEISARSFPHFVAELETGYVVMGHNQFFRGYTLFYCKRCVPELHDLEPDFRAKFLLEMSLVAEAVFRAFGAKKINYELLGNTDPHLHWHLFPRHKNDPEPASPVHAIDPEICEPPSARPSPAELQTLKATLLAKLAELGGEGAIVRAFGQRG